MYGCCQQQTEQKITQICRVFIPLKGHHHHSRRNGIYHQIGHSQTAPVIHQPNPAQYKPYRHQHKQDQHLLGHGQKRMDHPIVSSLSEQLPVRSVMQIYCFGKRIYDALRSLKGNMLFQSITNAKTVKSGGCVLPKNGL